MTLHELNNEWRLIQDAIEAADGELTPEIEARLDGFAQAFPVKVDGYCRLITNLELQAATIAEQAKPFKLEAKRIEARAKPRESAAERLRFRLREAMQLHGVSKLVTDLHTVSVYGIAPLITWSGGDKIPDGFRVETVAVDNAAAAQWFKENGWLPEGFTVQPKHAMRIS
jgi:hypothetical protein